MILSIETGPEATPAASRQVRYSCPCLRRCDRSRRRLGLHVLQALDALEKKAAAVQTGAAPDRAYFEKAVEFLRTFADKCHHGKEEDLLFKRMADRALSAETRRSRDGFREVRARGDGRRRPRGHAEPASRAENVDLRSIAYAEGRGDSPEGSRFRKREKNPGPGCGHSRRTQSGLDGRGATRTVWRR